MINFKKSFDVGKHGLGICDDQGNFQFFFLSGDASPIGLVDAPKPAIYVDGQSNVYKKTGPTNLDWALLVGDDLQSGVYRVLNGESFTISPRREMRVKDFLENFGTIQNFGRIVVD